MSEGAVDAATAAELLAISAAKAEVLAALRDARARGLTGSDLDAVMQAFDGALARAEALRRRVWPRHKGRLVVALDMACLVSPTGRSSRLVWKRDAWPPVPAARPTRPGL